MAKFPTIEEFAKSVADKVLDDYEYEGKTIREWVELILKDELTEVVRCKDCFAKSTWYTDKAYGVEVCGLSGFIVVEDNDFCSYGERREDDA